jgi:hypothetical protein
VRAYYARTVRALAISALLAATPAAADPRGAMTDYFDGEIAGGWTLMGMGAAGLTAGGFLYADGGPRARGASYVTFGFGAAHLAAGVYVNIASRVREHANGIAIERARGPWLAYEQRRMRGVSTQFLVLEIVEVALIAGGGTLALVGHANDSPRLEGAGYALAAEAAATLVFDIVASRRAHRYRAHLATDGGTVVIAGAQIRF